MTDSEVMAYVRKHGIPVLDAPESKAYFKALGLTPDRQLLGDVLFVPDLEYWGTPAIGGDKPVHLATLSAIIALIRDQHGAVIGCQATYLDPLEPAKWKPTGSPANSARKVYDWSEGEP